MSHDGLILSGNCNDEFEILIAKAAIIFDLRGLLTCCLLPSDDNIMFEISLDEGDKDMLSKIEILPRQKSSSEIPNLDLKETIDHKFLNPAEALLSIRDALPQKAKPSEGKSVKYRLAFSHKGGTSVVQSVYYKCPIIMCCFK